MKALVWNKPKDIRCEDVPDPKIEDDRDAIIKVSACAICGSALHLYDGFMPSMESGDVMGHEFMGEVMDVAPGATNALKVGDRVVIPFTILCGSPMCVYRHRSGRPKVLGAIRGAVSRFRDPARRPHAGVAPLPDLIHPFRAAAADRSK